MTGRDWTLTAEVPVRLRVSRSWVSRTRVSRVGLRQSEARGTLALLKALHVNAEADILEAEL